MKGTFIKDKADIICLILIIVIMLTVGIFIYKSRIEDSSNIMEEMANENREQNLADRDSLIVQEYNIDGKNYEVIGILNIPSLEIEYPVLSTTSTELLKVSLNKYWGPNPNKPGNFCILGHNYNDSRFFGKLNRIKENDLIQLTDMKGDNLNYYVYDTYI